MKSVIGERGRIVIPKQIRDRLGLEKGVIMEVDANGDRVILKAVRRKRKNWKDWIGAFEGEGLIEEYLKEKENDKRKEEK